MKRHLYAIPKRIVFACVLVALGACTAPDDVASPAATAPETPAPMASPPPAHMPASASSPTPAAYENPDATGFAPAPAIGWVIRSNCRMGSCNWERFDSVQRSGSKDVPEYALRLLQGDSTHSQDPYPLQPEGVEIRWRLRPVPMQVKCSRSAPYVAFQGQSEVLKLNPQGVSGVMQGAANLYFATCHGEYGNDADLARKFGYDLG